MSFLNKKNDMKPKDLIPSIKDKEGPKKLIDMNLIIRPKEFDPNNKNPIKYPDLPDHLDELEEAIPN